MDELALGAAVKRKTRVNHPLPQAGLWLRLPGTDPAFGSGGWL